MRSQPRVSVIIPVYNAEKYLQECLDSVVNQTLKDIEIICVDDGSTDSSCDLLKEYAETDVRFVVIRQENQGAGIARSRGLKEAKGKYVSFMDSDDRYAEHDSLEKLYYAAEKQGASICGGSLLFLPENGKLRPAAANGLEYFFRDERFIDYRDFQQDFYYQRFIFQRSFLEENELMFPPYVRYQDPPFFVKTMLTAKRFYSIPQDVYVYRMGESENKVRWTEKKACDAIRGMRDELQISREGKLDQLHSLVIRKRVRPFLEKVIEPLFLADCSDTMSDLLFSLRKAVDLNLAKELALPDLEYVDSILCRLIQKERGNGKDQSIDNRSVLRPQISLIISIFNAEEYLNACLRSAVDQTLKEIEIICVDDGSSDASLSIAKEFSQKDERVRIIQFSKNRSTLQTRKAGAMAANGAYVMFLDADDTLELNACQRLLDLMAVKNVDILQFGTFVDAEPMVKQSAVKWFEEFAKPFENYLFGRAVFDACFVENRFSFNFWNKIYRTELCKTAFSEIPDGYFHKAEDLFGFSLIAWYAKSFFGTAEKYYHYNFGRGITGHAHDLSLEELISYCRQKEVSEQLKQFLLRQGEFKRYAGAWEDRDTMLCQECVFAWMNGISPEDGGRGFDVLCHAWGASAISRIVAEKNTARVEEATRKAAGSEEMSKLEKQGIPQVFFFTQHMTDTSHAVPPDGFDRVIPIVMAADEKYSPYAGVTIESIREHAGSGVFYRIYILHSGLSDNRVRALEALSDETLHVVCCNIGFVLKSKKALLPETAYFTREMYYRFIIPECFWMFDKVVYLDCDTILLTDVAGIVPEDMKDSLLAAVRNDLSKYRREKLKLDFQLDPAGYFNSGVIVINCPQWLREKTVEKCFDYLRRTDPQKLICPDQDVLNAVCAGRVHYLNPAWNFYWHLANETGELGKVYRLTRDQIGEDYCLIHYASEKKPWSSPDMPMSKHFWKYARKSAFYEEIIFRNAYKRVPEEKDPPMERVSGTGSDKQLLQAQRDLACVNQKLVEANREIEGIHASWTYRIGRLVTWAPRKIRGLFRCVKEHGWGYTIRRIPEHFGIPMGIVLAKKEPRYKGVSKKKHDPELIVSLTSFPARIGTVHKTIGTILNQTEQPDKVILWLAKEQFPKRTRELPRELLEQRRYGLKIRWCKDIRSYKKLIPALRKYPEAVIVTADDDVYYDSDWLEKLYVSYKKWPEYIHCHRDTRFYMEDGEFKYVPGGKEQYSFPSYLHKLVGIGGVLYPPRCLHPDVMDQERFQKLAKTNDDLWFWFMAIRNGFKIHVVEGNHPVPRSIEETLNGPRLTEINDAGDHLFDKDLARMLEAFPEVKSKLLSEWAFASEYERCAAIPSAEKKDDYYRTLSPDLYPANLAEWYQRVTGKWLDLDKPKTFDEKIQWMKLYDATPLKTKLADKYLVRDWVREKIGEEYLVPLLGVWDRFDDIDFAALPDQFVLKANHGCGWNLIVKDKAMLDTADAKAKFDEWMKTNFAFKAGLELHYLNIKPKIIAEQYLENGNNDLYDYKVFCFDGKAESIMFLSERKKGLKMAFYDLEWNKLPYTYSFPRNEEDVPKPVNLGLLIRLSEILAEGFPHVRVDFYVLNDGSLKFGEMTFTSASGTCKWNPPEQDRVCGDLIRLPPKSPIPERIDFRPSDEEIKE